VDRNFHIGVDKSFADDDELVDLLLLMFEDLCLLEELRIRRTVLRKFLLTARSQYRSNPFHNFRHCFCVAQMMYAFIWSVEKLRATLSKTDQAILLTACVCHDLDHPGTSNTYQINSKSDIAERYKENKSPLENHHLSMSLKILSVPETDIFANVEEELLLVHEDMTRMILATDMLRHTDVLLDFENKLLDFDFSSPVHMSCLKLILVKAADVSNECRPLSSSEEWVERLLAEYFAQSRKEKKYGYPLTPHMDPDRVTKPTAQTYFIRCVLLPMFKVIARLLPEFNALAVQPLMNALAFYEDMAEEQPQAANGLAASPDNDP
jgi:high affinity cGMP-specific 3',5'-cyclic phosphodiesterase 9